MKGNVALRAWVVAIILSVFGCATPPRLGGLTVSLVSIRPVAMALLETTAELTLRFTNETGRPLQLGGGSHRLYVNGSYVGRAVSNQSLLVSEFGTATQIVTAHLGNLALMRTAQEIEQSAVADYQIESMLQLSRDNGGGRLETIATGRLDLSGFLAGSSAGGN
jgi:hypothetical protein